MQVHGIRPIGSYVESAEGRHAAADGGAPWRTVVLVTGDRRVLPSRPAVQVLTTSHVRTRLPGDSGTFRRGQYDERVFKVFELGLVAVVLGACLLLAACGGGTDKRCYAGTSCRPGGPCTPMVCPGDDAIQPADASDGSGGGATAVVPRDAATAMIARPAVDARVDDGALDAGAAEDAAKPAPALDAALPVAGGSPLDASTLPTSDASACVPNAESCNGVDDDCNGAVDEIFDLTIDPLHCGRCGHVCAAGSRCESGECHVDTPAPQDAGTVSAACHADNCSSAAELGCCGTECVALNTNQNCGACGVVCGLVGAGLTCTCQRREGKYGCYGELGAALSLCPR